MICARGGLAFLPVSVMSKMVRQVAIKRVMAFPIQQLQHMVIFTEDGLAFLPVSVMSQLWPQTTSQSHHLQGGVAFLLAVLKTQLLSQMRMPAQMLGLRQVVVFKTRQPQRTVISAMDDLAFLCALASNQ